MKIPSTSDAFDDLLDVLSSGSSHPIARVQYMSDAQAWVDLEDVLSVTINKKGVDNRWNVFSLLPPVSEMTVQMNNFAQKYSDGSGSPFEGILTRNRKLRAFLGYLLNGTSKNIVSISLANESLVLWHTSNAGGVIKSDSGAEALPPSLAGLTFQLYGSGLYGSGLYQIEGYWESSVIQSGSLDELRVTADMGDIDIYMRSSVSSETLSSENYTLLGETISGIKQFLTPSIDDKKRYFQVAAVFRTGTWGLGQVSELNLHSRYNLEFFSQGIFLADDPQFTSSKDSYGASFSARDYFKKALETKISIPSYTGDIIGIVRLAASKVGIPWTTASLPTVSKTVTIPSGQPFTTVTAQAILDECITYMAATVNANYRLRIKDDGLLTLVSKPASAVTADYSLHYAYDLFAIQKGYSSNNLLQAASVLAKENAVQEQIQLANQTLTSIGDHTITLSYEALFKEVEVYYQTSDPSVNAEIISSALNNVVIRLTGSGTVSVNVKVNGCRFTGSRPYSGESFASINHIIPHVQQGVSGSEQRRDGITYKFVNRFISSDAEAKAVADLMVAGYGNKKYQLTVTVWGLPIAEIDDRFMVYEKYTATNSIFVLENISQSFNAAGASYRSTLTFTDLGFTLPAFIWDANGQDEGPLDLLWDSGLIWDQDLGFGEIDNETYENTRPVICT